MLTKCYTTQESTRSAFLPATERARKAIDMYFAPLISSRERKALLESYVIALEKNPFTEVEQAIRRSTVPLRIIWGTSDTIFDAANADYPEQTFSQSRGVRRLPGAKLFWPEEQPEVVSMEAISLWNVSLLCPDSQC